MKVIIDTSIWSLALRRKQESSHPQVALFKDIIAEGRAVLLGAVRQEILSGIRHVEQFQRLRDYLRAFPDIELVDSDYELAAEFCNTCRKKGIQGANTDNSV